MNKKRRTIQVLCLIFILGLTGNTKSADEAEEVKDVFEGFFRLEQVEVEKDSALMKVMRHIERNKGPISIWQGKSSNLLYIVDLAEQSLTILEADKQPSLEQAIPIKVGRGAISVIANRDDSVAFVTNLIDGTLSVIDVKARKVSGTLNFKGDSEPYCQIFGADESQLYVVTRKGDSVFVVDPVQKTVIDTLGVKDLARDVQLKHCYGSCHEDKRRIMQESSNRKPTIPNNTLTVSASKLTGNGLRRDHERRYLLHYTDYLIKQDKSNAGIFDDNKKDSVFLEVDNKAQEKRYSDGLSLPGKLGLLDTSRLRPWRSPKS